MSRVIFSIQYDIFPEKRNDYVSVIKELKNLVMGDGLDSYSVYEFKGKPNSFEEIYIYDSKEAWENSDENIDERVDILMTKLSDMIKEKSTKYNTLFELDS